MIMIPLTLNQIKSAKVSDLEFFRHLLTLETWMWAELTINSALALCYESRLKGLSRETTLVLSNTRELNRVPSTE